MFALVGSKASHLRLLMLKCLWCSVILNCNSWLNADEVDENHFWLKLVAARDAIVTGEFTAECSLRHRVPNSDASNAALGEPEGSTIYCAFDELQLALRFDRTEKSETTKLIRTPSKVIWLGAGSTTVMQESGAYEMPLGRPFYVKSMGLAHWTDLEKGTTFSEMVAIYRDSPFKLVRTDNDHVSGILTVDWSLGDVLKRTARVDTKKGYWPVHWELANRNGSASEWKTLQVVDIEPVRIDDYWVPLKYVGSNEIGDQLEILFNWKQINRSLPSHIFSAEGLVDKGVTKIIDLSTEKRSEVNLETGPSEKEVKVSNYIVLMLSTLMILVLVVWLARRKP